MLKSQHTLLIFPNFQLKCNHLLCLWNLIIVFQFIKNYKNEHVNLFWGILLFLLLSDLYSTGLVYYCLFDCIINIKCKHYLFSFFSIIYTTYVYVLFIIVINICRILNQCCEVFVHSSYTYSISCIMWRLSPGWAAAVRPTHTERGLCKVFFISFDGSRWTYFRAVQRL